MAKRFYGWQKSRMELPNKHKFNALWLPDIIDLSQYRPEVIDQLEVNRCTGCGIGGAMSGKMSELNLNPGKGFYWSPDDLYNGARVLEGTLNSDVGAQPADVYKWIQEHGAIRYGDMPITPGVSVVNPLSLESEAIMLPNFTPVQIETRPDTVVSHILDAMAAGHFVTQGAAFFAAWEDYKGGPLPLKRPIDPIGGYHETFYYKANTVTQTFYLQNSWGPSWGENGLYEMPFAQVPILARMGMDLHYATFTAPPVLSPIRAWPHKYSQAKALTGGSALMVPVSPVSRVAPVAPVTPVTRVALVPRITPVKKVAPVERVAPVTPVKPVDRTRHDV